MRVTPRSPSQIWMSSFFHQNEIGIQPKKIVFCRRLRQEMQLCALLKASARETQCRVTFGKKKLTLIISVIDWGHSIHLKIIFTGVLAFFPRLLNLMIYIQSEAVTSTRTVEETTDCVNVAHGVHQVGIGKALRTTLHWRGHTANMRRWKQKLFPFWRQFTVGDSVSPRLADTPISSCLVVHWSFRKIGIHKLPVVCQYIKLGGGVQATMKKEQQMQGFRTEILSFDVGWGSVPKRHEGNIEKRPEARTFRT